MNVIELLRLLRIRRRWSQAECANKLGVSVSALRSWEYGSRKPKPIVLRAIADFTRRLS